MKRPMQANRFRGFTMIEMLVAMAITIGIVLFINQIMSSVKDAVSHGTSTSHVIQNARVVIDHLDADVAEMVGPAAGGILIITSQRVQTKLTKDSPNVTTLPMFYCDQLSFIRNASSLEPICFSGDNNLSSSSQAPYVKVWYGHAQKVLADGSDDGILGAAGINRYPIDWVMGRQALFLDPNPTTLQNHADSALENAVVDYGGSYPSVKPAQLLYAGIADVVNQTLDELNNDPTIGILNMANVLERLKYSYASQRLRVNIYAPEIPLDGWRVSQMHPLLVPNVSDVIVEFAGDFVPQDGKLDVYPGSSSKEKGRIVWYGGFDDIEYSRIPTVPATIPKTPTVDEAGALNTSAYKDNATGFVKFNANLDNAKTGYVWTKNTPNWPWLVRIRFRVQDPHGTLVGPDGRPGYEFERIIAIPH